MRGLRQLALLVLLGCGAPSGHRDPTSARADDPRDEAEARAAGALDPSSAGSVAEHMALPGSDEAHRDEYASAVARGHAILVTFAREHGWSEHAREPSFERMEIFSTREALWHRLLELYDAPADTEMTGTGPVAGIEVQTLLSVTAEEYERAHPEYAAQPDAMALLYAHEMIHRLHVRVLHGNDDAMGPRWFYEGLAVIGSGQDFDVGHVAYESADEALAGAHDTSDPTTAYRRYSAALRFFLRAHDLAALVERAGEEDFEAWLRDAPARP